MTKRLWCALLAVLALTSVGARADDDETPSNWRAFLVGGLTKGGDVLFTSTITGTGSGAGGRQHVYAGNILQVGVGGLWTSDKWPIAAGISVNYHTDDSTGETNATLFKRWPIEAIGYLLNDDRKWRAGLGARYVVGARLDGTANVCPTKLYIKYDETLSPVAEVGWALTKSAWLNFRVVKERYKETSVYCDGAFFSPTEKPNGSHVGVNLLYAF